MLQINLVLEIMAHRSGCLWIVVTFRSRSGCSNLQRKILLPGTPACGVCYITEILLKYYLKFKYSQS